MIFLFLPVSIQTTTHPFIILYPWLSWALAVDVFSEGKTRKQKQQANKKQQEKGMLGDRKM